ncbi:PilN domain-containing protein [Pseudoalteromonas sp. MMG010]|uniref:PilN domain-containing protein n=1 Tax=Pseudoalteromonas sp. MMG010 TaxID=2822685 RepID=UPI001B39D313|nr:PilN domain-containing protein [Pseudoalteromonas sp. MMG010]MBQ4832647.1 PilN domain-containing protein [Pseudoalteromonas sp. MMG010]
MKNRINFYQKSLRIKYDPVPLALLLGTWLAAFVFVFIVWGGYFFQQNIQSSLSIQSINELAQAKLKLQKLKTQLSDKQYKQPLIEQLRSLQQEQLHKRQIFAYLADASTQAITDYAQVMQDLARYHEPNVWLTRLQFSGQKILLQGHVSESKYLPLWFSNLHKSSFFIDKEFSVVEFSQDGDGMSFNVATDISTIEVKP